jgi:hypothetical protein
VKELRSYLIDQLKITAWMDIYEMKTGTLSKKIYEGIANSKIVIAFITPEYFDSKNCLNEICLAKKCGKNIIFFITEDYAKDIEVIIVRKMPNDVYRKDLVFLRDREQLVEETKSALSRHTVRFKNLLFLKKQITEFQLFVDNNS